MDGKQQCNSKWPKPPLVGIPSNGHGLFNGHVKSQQLLSLLKQFITTLLRADTLNNESLHPMDTCGVPNKYHAVQNNLHCNGQGIIHCKWCKEMVVLNMNITKYCATLLC